MIEDMCERQQSEVVTFKVHLESNTRVLKSRTRGQRLELLEQLDPRSQRLNVRDGFGEAVGLIRVRVEIEHGAQQLEVLVQLGAALLFAVVLAQLTLGWQRLVVSGARSRLPV